MQIKRELKDLNNVLPPLQVIWWAGDTSIPFNQSFYRQLHPFQMNNFEKWGEEKNYLQTEDVIHFLPRFCVIAKHLPTVHATLNPFIYWSEKFICWSEKLELPFLPALKMYFLQRMMSANFRSILSTWRRSLVPNCCRWNHRVTDTKGKWTPLYKGPKSATKIFGLKMPPPLSVLVAYPSYWALEGGWIW